MQQHISTNDMSIVGDTLQQAVEDLHLSVHSLLEKIEPHVDVTHEWGYNPLFERKLALHRSLLALIENQQQLSEGLVILFQYIDEYGKSMRRRPPMPPPPRPHTQYEGFLSGE